MMPRGVDAIKISVEVTPRGVHVAFSANYMAFFSLKNNALYYCIVCIVDIIIDAKNIFT